MKTFDIRNSKLIEPITVVIILGLLYWLDTIQISWRRHAFQTFNIKPFFYFTIALLILFAMLVIFLTWFLFVYSRLSWVMPIFCLLTGTFLLGLLLSYITANPILRSILNLGALTGLVYVISSLGSASMMLQAGAFVLVIGLIDLVHKIQAITSHDSGTK